MSPQLHGALSRHIEATSFVSELPVRIARVRGVLGDASFSAASGCSHNGTSRCDRLRAHRLHLISRSSFVRAEGRSFVPARRTSIASRAGAVKAGRCAWLAAGSGVSRPRLGPPRARREDQAGRTPASSVLVSSKALQHRPADAGKLLASAIASTLWCNRLLGTRASGLRSHGVKKYK